MLGAEVEAARKVPVSAIPVGEPKPGSGPAQTGYMPIDLTREVRAGLFASAADDREPIGARINFNGSEYVKVEVPNGMMSFRAWRKL
jgi:hypothetical protein